MRKTGLGDIWGNAIEKKGDETMHRSNENIATDDEQKELAEQKQKEYDEEEKLQLQKQLEED
jgi:hypothetical protein